MDRKNIKNNNPKLFIKYAELTDQDMFYLEGKDDVYVSKVQSFPVKSTKEILVEPAVGKQK